MINVAKVTPRAQPRQYKLTVYFAVAYLASGLACGQYGIVAQPMQFFLMQQMKLSAAEISCYMGIVMLPWVVKPLYGLVCDFIPLFGYRRKSYLILANMLACIGYAVMFCSPSLFVIVGALFCTAVAMAVATALMVGLAVEQGRKDGQARKYFCVQEIGYYAANMLAALVGGWLCHTLAPSIALKFAAGTAVVPPMAVAILTTVMLKENRSELNLERLRETGKSLLSAIRSPALWSAAMFSGCWNFIPCNGVPIYFYESNSLHFSQAFIGQLSAWNAAGLLSAALLYPHVTRNMAVKRQLLLAVCLLCVSVLSYLGLTDCVSAIALEFLRGVAAMVCMLSLYLLAATYCPAGAEVSVMALLVSVRNFATDASTFAGGQLFTHALHGKFQTLVLVATAAPLLSLLLWMRLPKESGSPS